VLAPERIIYHRGEMIALMCFCAMDLFVVPSVTFELLYVFIMVRLARRDLVWINVTLHPTAEWIARQITEAFPWNEVPRYLIRDRYRNAL
jgi:hypothetical protein